MAPTTWLVNGGRARPAGRPDPVLTQPEAGQAASPVVTGGRNGDGEIPARRPSGIAIEGQGVPETLPSGLTAPEPAALAPARPHPVEGFQRVMRRFLETQQAVMLGLPGRRRARSGRGRG